MAFVGTWNYTDTSSTSTVSAVTPATLNYEADFAKKDSSADTQVVLTNVTSPLDRPETIRYACQRVANVYSGTGIEAGYQAPNRAGVSVLIQDNTVYTQEDATTGIRYDHPFTAHLVLKVPYSSVVTATLINTAILRLMGACYEQGGSSMGERIVKLLRGSLTPNVLV